MPIEADIDYTLSAQENADLYFKKAKEFEKKSAGAEKAAKELELRLEEATAKPAKEKRLRRIKSRKWYERFNWFFASNGMLAIGGRNAQQNDEINSKYFDEKDLAFHANVFGASLVILKGGAEAEIDIKEEAAQFAACYSRAWETGQSSADVFAARREQVTKSSQSGYIASGSFLIKGEREWFRNLELALCAFAGSTEIFLGKSALGGNAVLEFEPNKIIVDAPPLVVAPLKTCQKSNVAKYVLLKPGKINKAEASKHIAQILGIDDIDYIMQHLPAGGFSIK
ncbi:MAG: NFACT RNA binding domain-containing protein [Candidatus Micrarchaeaceae archaeon]